MFAAASGDPLAVKTLLDAGANPNAKELARGHTPLMFAAAADRLDAVKVLAGARRRSERRDEGGRSRGAQPGRRSRRPQPRPAGRRPRRGTRRPRAAAAARRARPQKPRVAGVDRQFLLNELVASEGGMTPLLFAARQGYADVVTTLLDAGVSVNQLKGGDGTSPLLIATINGQFDLGTPAARARRRSEPRGRERRDAALRRDQRAVGAAHALPAAARVSRSEARLPRAS